MEHSLFPQLLAHSDGKGGGRESPLPLTFAVLLGLPLHRAQQLVVVLQLLVVRDLQGEVVGVRESEAEQSLRHVQLSAGAFVQEDETLDVVTVLGQGEELNLLVHADGLKPGHTVRVDGDSCQFHGQCLSGATAEQGQGRGVAYL